MDCGVADQSAQSAAALGRRLGQNVCRAPLRAAFIFACRFKPNLTRAIHWCAPRTYIDMSPQNNDWLSAMRQHAKWDPMAGRTEPLTKSLQSLLALIIVYVVLVHSPVADADANASLFE